MFGGGRKDKREWTEMPRVHSESRLKGNRCKGLKATPSIPCRGIFNKGLEVRGPERSVQ